MPQKPPSTPCPSATPNPQPAPSKESVLARSPVVIGRGAPREAVLRESLRVIVDPWVRSGVSVYVSRKGTALLIAPRLDIDRLAGNAFAFVDAEAYKRAPEATMREVYQVLNM